MCPLVSPNGLDKCLERNVLLRISLDILAASLLLVWPDCIHSSHSLLQCCATHSYSLRCCTAHKIGWILGVFARSVDKLTVIRH